MSDITITDAIHSDAWDRYVMHSRSSSFCHLYGWRNVIAKSFGHDSFYLLAEEDGMTRGILPLFEIRSRIFGSALVSMPFLDYGGICAEDELVEKSLLHEAAALAHRKKVDYLELRHQDRAISDLTDKINKVNLKRRLYPDPDVLWRSLDAKVRNQVRKAQKTGLTFAVGGADKINVFYEVFSRSMRDLGSPVYQRDFFLQSMQEFPGSCEAFLVLLNDTVIGAALAFYFKEQMEIPWASCLREYFPYCPNNLLYWEAMKRGCERGYTYFNFGRSTRDSTHYKFKQQWGTEEQQLYYQFVLLNVRELPDMSPESKRYHLAVNVWKKLPLAASNFIGPRISKYIS